MAQTPSGAWHALSAPDNGEMSVLSNDDPPTEFTGDAVQTEVSVSDLAPEVAA